jgi:hypothetical protein
MTPATARGIVTELNEALGQLLHRKVARGVYV